MPVVITLYDDIWDIEDGIYRAPVPEHNVQLNVSNDLVKIVRECRTYISDMGYMHPAEMQKAYVVMKAPKWDGHLYNDLSGFTNRASVVFTISDASVLYVVEDEASGFRLIYDLSEYFPYLDGDD